METPNFDPRGTHTVEGIELQVGPRLTIFGF